MAQPQTIIDKIWDTHVVTRRDDGQCLLYVDRVLLQENCFHAFDKLRREKRGVRNPGQAFAFADHYVPTINRERGIEDPERRNMVEMIEADSKANGILLFGAGDPRHGILHVVGPEQGITQPGLVIAGADSHTSTHGALGAYAFGVGSSEAAHALAVQGLWRPRPRTMRVTVRDELPVGTTSKDLILALIGKIGAAGAINHVIEYAGPGIAALSIEQRMTVCNMSIEAGARAGLVAPDDKAFEYMKGRPFAPKGEDWEKALVYWRTLITDPGAGFDSEITLEAGEIAPMVTWAQVPSRSCRSPARCPTRPPRPTPANARRWSARCAI